MAIRAGLKKVTQLISRPKRLFFITWVELAGRWFLGITFIYACSHKILAPDYFAKIVYGYYLFPDFSSFASRLRDRGITDSVSLCEKLLEDTGVAIIPGCEFGRDKNELTARLAYVNFNGDRVLKAVQEMAENESLTFDFLNDYCGDTLSAIDLILDWLHT